MSRMKLRKRPRAALCLLLALLLLLPACSGEKASVPSLKEVEKYESLHEESQEGVLAGLGLSEEDVEWEDNNRKLLATVKERRKIAGADFIELLGFGMEAPGGVLVTLRYVCGAESEDEAWELMEKLYEECCAVYGDPDPEINGARPTENRISHLLSLEDRALKGIPKEYWDIGERTWFSLQMFCTDEGEIGIWMLYQFIHDLSRDFPTI